MEREIKFRAWDNSWTIKEMIYFGIFDTDDGLHCKDGVTDIREAEIMQYTGLKDKNGKEIYEGDMLMIHQIDSNRKEVARAKNLVRWNLGEAKFDFEWCANGLIGVGGSSFSLFLHNFRKPANKESALDWYFEIEVIGNIYENPELLKSAKG